MQLSFLKSFKVGIEMIFRVVVILFLLSLSASTNYFYNKWSESEADNQANQKVIERYTKEKETIRESNPMGQERAATVSVVVDASLIKQVVGQELRELERRWNVSADERMARLHYKTDITMTTHLAGLRVAKLDTVINVVTVLGVDSTRKAKVSRYNDGYNLLDIVDLGDTTMVTGKIRNKITNMAYSGPYPRFLKVLPAFWKPRPIFNEVYSYNPLSGTDTLRSVITNQRIKKNQTK